jgi:hypothetical protein
MNRRNRIGTDLARQKDQQVDLMKKILLLFLVAVGFIAFVPQKAKAGGYFGISVGPAYCDPYPVYYGGYYPHYYRQYYYHDSPYGYGNGYWRHHRHWHHWHNDDDD